MLLAAPVTTLGGEAKPTALAVPLANKTAEKRSANEILTTNGLLTSLRIPQPAPDLQRESDKVGSAPRILPRRIEGETNLGDQRCLFAERQAQASSSVKARPSS